MGEKEGEKVYEREKEKEYLYIIDMYFGFSWI